MLPVAGAPEPSDEPVPVTYSRKNPLSTELIRQHPGLQPRSPDKEVRRFAFALPEGTLTYNAGDALGVWPTNRPALVEEWLARTGLDADEQITVKGEARPSSTPSPTTSTSPGSLPTRCAGCTATIPTRDSTIWPATRGPACVVGGRQAIDIITEFPVTGSVQDWLAVLKPLAPRLYSIHRRPWSIRASGSHRVSGAVPDASAAPRRLLDLPRRRAARRADAGSSSHQCPVRTARADGTAPMIMIGPGTGAAPVPRLPHDRSRTGATGENWLFFGDRHEGQPISSTATSSPEMNESGVLTQLDLAFSRDPGGEGLRPGPDARPRRRDLGLIHRGAHVRVRRCREDGRRRRRCVARDRRRAGPMSPHMAESYLAALAADERYVRDVH